MSLKLDRELTPCRGICSTTAFGDEICIGCGRTLEQVLEWSTYSDHFKKEIIRGIHGNSGSSIDNRQSPINERD